MCSRHPPRPRRTSLWSVKGVSGGCFKPETPRGKRNTNHPTLHSEVPTGWQCCFQNEDWSASGEGFPVIVTFWEGKAISTNPATQSAQRSNTKLKNVTHPHTV